MRLRDRPTTALELEVEDHGSGLDAATERRGLGIVTMRERAELLGGTMEFVRPARGGTLVRLRVPTTASGCMTDPITVLLVDDHILVRRGFRRLLEDDPGIDVVGEASNGEEAVALTASLAAAGRRDGLRDAGHERHRGHAADSGRRGPRSPS